MITFTVNGHDLAPTLSTEEAAQLLGCSVDVLYDGGRAGTAPVEPLKLGTRLRWPTARLLEVLGLAPAA